MAKQIILSLTLIIFTIFTARAADFKELLIKQGHLEWREDQGVIALQNLNLSHQNFQASLEAQNYDLSKENKTFRVQGLGFDFGLKNIEGGIIDSIDHLMVGNINGEFRPHERFYLEIENTSFGLGDGIQSIEALNVDCKSSASRNGDVMSFLLPCLELGKFYMPSFNLDKVSQKTFTNAFPLTEEIEKGLSFNGKIKNIHFNVVNNQFYLTLEAKMLFKLKLKGNGSIHYNPQTSLIDLHLQKVKAGWFSVKKTVLKQIRKAGIKNLKIEGDHIYIQL